MQPTSDEIYGLKERIAANFNEGHWQDVGLLTGCSEMINNHTRLLRSLGWGDPDYEGHVAKVLMDIIDESPDNFTKIQTYVDGKFGDNSTYISDQPSKRRITFAPNVFKVPDVDLRSNLVAVMMPFRGFENVCTAIKGACSDIRLDCLRADDIWEASTFIQDIVNLIVQARVVVCDFSGRNANVFYETGIAHTLGKTVVPLSQSQADIPSDLLHHRALVYLNNSEGLAKMRGELTARLQTIIGQSSVW